MKKLHSTLKPSTNIVLIFIWGSIAGSIILYSPDRPYILGIIGAVIGLICGFFQFLSIQEAKEKFLDAVSVFDVRAKLNSTKWGKRYLNLLWSGQLFLLTFTFILSKFPIIDIWVGYFSLMFTREIVTLKSTFELNSLFENKP